jgi:hypothetical protein
LSCLRVIYNLRSKLDAAQLLEFIPPVCEIIDHPSDMCRNEMYKILMWAYDSYRSVADVSHFLLFIMFVLSRDKPESEIRNEIVSRCREILLRGLSDDDLPMRSVFPTSHVLKLYGDLFQIDCSEFLETQYQAS